MGVGFKFKSVPLYPDGLWKQLFAIKACLGTKYVEWGVIWFKYGMEREWKQIDEGNGKKNGNFYWVYGWSQGMETNGNHHHQHQVMDFVTWGRGEDNKLVEYIIIK